MLFPSDRCLQTAKPVAGALGVPIYVEHGWYIRIISLRFLLMGYPSQDYPNGILLLSLDQGSILAQHPHHPFVLGFRT